MRRLYLQIYLTFLGVLLLFGLLVALAWWLIPGDGRDARSLDGIALLLGDALPVAPDRARDKLAQLARTFDADLTLRAADGALIASAGALLPAPPPALDRSGWMHDRGAGPTFAFKLADGRWVTARTHGRHRPFALPLALALMLVAIALGSYPLVRRVTGRLERLRARVEALGAGDLSARVSIEGRDEVADLARSFNRAAERIEKLVAAHKTLLAQVSHELRTPLTRIRMALELLPGDARPELRARLAHDIEDLDALIGELLLASRLDAGRPLQLEQVDVLALAAEEAAAYGVEVSGQPVTVQGEGRLLRRLVRNLLDNAQRHAPGAAVEVGVERLPGGGARLTVADRGAGIPEAERDRIFEAFYRVPGAKPRGDGAGVGLALVRQIARQHGGDVRCLPRSGGGSVFEVILTDRCATPGSPTRTGGLLPPGPSFPPGRCG
jgi:signal transduction histidine kinase